MNVIIVSKTRMKNTACIGALKLDGSNLRLLSENGHYPPINTDFNIGQIWDIEFEKADNCDAPHVEDVLLLSKKYLGNIRDDVRMLQIVERVKGSVWRGSPDNLFDGSLLWTNSGSGYISMENDIPKQSVGFWLPDKRLVKNLYEEKIRYNYPNSNGWRSLPYVGFANPVDAIPLGTLLRVSLARWWSPNNDGEYRCSLQLSGWYEFPEGKNSEQEDDVLPLKDLI